MPTKKETLAAERETARDELRVLCPVGTVIRTSLHHVSKSGMTRDISLYLPRVDFSGKPYIHDITHLVSTATGDKISPTGKGIRVGGCGMDMGFHLVYGLSRTLYSSGHNCTGGPGTCPSNDHTNDYGRLCREYDNAHETTAAAGVVNTPRDEWRAYVAERQEWIAAQPTYATDRVHSDGGYALSHSWL